MSMMSETLRRLEAQLLAAIAVGGNKEATFEEQQAAVARYETAQKAANHLGYNVAVVLKNQKLAVMFVERPQAPLAAEAHTCVDQPHLTCGVCEQYKKQRHDSYSQTRTTAECVLMTCPDHAHELRVSTKDELFLRFAHMTWNGGSQ